MRLVTTALLTCLFVSFSSGFALSADTKNGMSLYQSCTSCHMADGSKHGLNKLSEDDFVMNLKRIRDDESSKWKPMKKIFKTYSEKDIADLAAYVHTLKK